MQNHLLRSVNSKGKRKDASNDMKIQSSIRLLVLPFTLSSMNCFLTKVYMSLPKQGCDLKMSVGTFASDFDDRLTQSIAPSIRLHQKEMEIAITSIQHIAASSFRFVALASGAHQT